MYNCYQLKRLYVFLSMLFFAGLIVSFIPAQEASPAPAAKHDSLQARGFNITIEDLVRLLDLQRSLFLDPAAKVNVDWQDKFDELVVREIPATANRYAYAVDSDQGLQYFVILVIRGTHAPAGYYSRPGIQERALPDFGDQPAPEF